MSKNIAKTKFQKKREVTGVATIVLICLLVITPITLFSASAGSSEPSLEAILDDLGYTNIGLADIETFLSGTYNITLLAEYANYHAINVLSYYPNGTSDYQTVFTGPEGATGTLGGYVIPPLSKIFVVDTEFGLSILSPEHRYFTEHLLNPDFPEQHARVYVNLDDPNMFLVGFENYFGGYDRDYNDMVFSLICISPQIVDVTRSHETPNYDQSIEVTAQVVKGSWDIESVILSYQIGSGSWTNVTMSLGSGVYGANIESKAYSTIVNYKVYASDTAGNSDVSSVSSYIVGDFVPPIISDVVQVPSTPYANSAVTILAVVTEPPKASGLKNVTMMYKINNNGWSSVEMTLQDMLWVGTIPGQNPNDVVKFFVEAFDNAENSDKTSTFASIVVTPNRAPTADFSFLSTVYTDEVADFDASASYDSDGSITIYVWDFGDGATDLGVKTSHSYAEDGEYMVILTVYDNNGAIGKKTAPIIVKNRPPVADVRTSAKALNKKEVVTFDASSSYDPDGTIVEYSWDFGDKNRATGVSTSHSYTDSGTYSVTLTVTDNDGAKASITITKKVSNESPVAVITETLEPIYVKEVIAFNGAESYDPDGIIAKYSWDFGDGNTATGEQVNHAYEDDGVFTVTLTVTDDNGATDSATATKTIQNRSPVASFTENAITVMTDEAIHFDASTSYDHDGFIASYTWAFGDGTTATGVVVDHAYEDNSVYTVTLTVTDDDGATDSATATKTVLNRSPVASFTGNVGIVMPEESIYYDASASYDLDGSIVSYMWDFGDGNTATGMTIDHAYLEEGIYIVTLTVTDDDGASVSVVDGVTVELTVSLAIISVIGLAITTLTATLLYGLFIRRKKKKQTEEEF